jgi:hypothetical protein
MLGTELKGLKKLNVLDDCPQKTVSNISLKPTACAGAIAVVLAAPLVVLTVPSTWHPFSPLNPNDDQPPLALLDHAKAGVDVSPV